MNEIEMVRVTIEPYNKKNCVDVTENILNQELIKNTSFEGKFPNWKGQKRIYAHAWRWGQLIFSMKKDLFNNYNWDDFNRKWESVHLEQQSLVNEGFTEWEMGECFDGGCWDYLIYEDENGNEMDADEYEELEEQYLKLCDSDDCHLYPNDGEFHDFYLLCPIHVTDVENFWITRK